ncbi:MAG: ferritin-like domain-containing protein [Leptolyngbyaceae cyanobacterium T60_A2020_046]|nr:ferritin-like domain-containing protein [Leptolyngbyaceae cyanobacterium T60_A2020_046]
MTDLNQSHLAHRTDALSRRKVVVGGAIAGFAGALGLSAVTARPSQAAHNAKNIEILNIALYYEHQAIWAYGAAAGLLSDSDVGRAVLAVALENQADHMEHRNVLTGVIRGLGGTPVVAEDSYDLSAYIERGEGNLDSDVNIAKLALALETDAAIAYGQEAAQLTIPDLITAGASIGAVEASHATLIRAAFKSLGVDLEVVPSAFINADTRSAWIVPV